MNKLHSLSKVFDDLPKPIAVVCHDAGAANLIIGWLHVFVTESITNLADLRIVANGPASTLFKKNFPSIELTSFERAISTSSSLISGTGWASSFEHDARSLAREKGLYVIAVLDHWVNYRQRFIYQKNEVLPDEIWVGDQYAYDIAKLEFPYTKLKLLDNIYLSNVVERINKLEKCLNSLSSDKVLYVLEPIRQPWPLNSPMFGEFQALDYFLAHLQSMGIDKSAEIRLRPHPSDPPNKYQSWIDMNLDYNISMAPEQSIEVDIAWSDFVVGCQTFALVIAARAGKKVFSTLPSWAPRSPLPYTDILILADLVGPNNLTA